MKKAVVLLLLVSTAGSVSARPKHWYTDKKFWLGEAVITASIFLDYHSTAARPGYRERSPLLGPYPTNRRIALVGLSDFVFESGIHIVSYKLLQNDSSPTWRTLSLIAQPTISSSLHISSAVHNYRLPKDMGIK